MQVVVAAEHEVPEHARVSLCRQAQQATSLSDDELEYASASSPAQVTANMAQAWYHTLLNVNKASIMPATVTSNYKGLHANHGAPCCSAGWPRRLEQQRWRRRGA